MEPAEERNVCRPEGERSFINMDLKEVLELVEHSNDQARKQGMKLEREAGHSSSPGQVRSWAFLRAMERCDH